MGIEDEPRSRAAAAETNGQESGRRDRPDHDAREVGPERALDKVRQMAVEASELLRAGGLKPTGLVYVPRGARSCPPVGRAFSGVRRGHGWHVVVRCVIVGTAGRP